MMPTSAPELPKPSPAAEPAEMSWKEGGVEDVSKIQNCYCPACENEKGNATTTLLPTKIPFFREIIIMTLTCPDCSFRNSDISFGGAIQERGERITLTVTSEEDLNRQLVKSDSATIEIPSIEFEIPSTTQRGKISTVEGVLKNAIESMEQSQADRLRLGDVDTFYRVRDICEKLKMMTGTNFQPYDIVLDDPAGNSFVENPHAPDKDPNLRHEKYYRTPNQDMALGLQPSQEAVKHGMIDDSNPAHKNVANVAEGRHNVEVSLGRIDTIKSDESQEALTFPATCPSCRRDTKTSMCTTDIPHFKEVILMSLACDECGYRSNEIKAGGGVPRYGTKITLAVDSAEDLAREVLKSDTAGVAIPEIEMKLEEGGLDGLYSTVEGLIRRMHERLASTNPFGTGDSAVKQHRDNDGGAFSEMSPRQVKYVEFMDRLKSMADGKFLPFTFIIDDPLSNSFIGPIASVANALALQAEKEGNKVCYGNYTDSSINIEEYTRSFEQNEMLGLNDIQTENYTSSGGRKESESHGTDVPSDLPDRLKKLEPRGPDHYRSGS